MYQVHKEYKNSNKFQVLADYNRYTYNNNMKKQNILKSPVFTFFVHKQKLSIFVSIQEITNSKRYHGETIKSKNCENLQKKNQKNLIRFIRIIRVHVFIYTRHILYFEELYFWWFKSLPAKVIEKTKNVTSDFQNNWLWRSSANKGITKKYRIYQWMWFWTRVSTLECTKHNLRKITRNFDTKKKKYCTWQKNKALTFKNIPLF